MLMHDLESDIIKNQSMQEKLNIILKEIGIRSDIKKIGTCEIEKKDYYSKCFSWSPSVVTNRGCLKPQNTNIDLIQIIQKG